MTAPVDVGMPTLPNPTLPSEEVEFVTDLDDVLESEKCSCNAGDDNPY